MKMKRLLIIALLFLAGCAGDKYRYLEDTAAVDISDAPALGTPANDDKILTINTGNVAGNRLSAITFADAPWLLTAGTGTVVARNVEDTMTDGSNIPDGAAIKAYGDTYWLGSGTGLESQPTATLQLLTSTGSGAGQYEWSTYDNLKTALGVPISGTDFYSPSAVDAFITPSAISDKLIGQDISVSSVNVPQSSVPQLIYLKPASGAGGVGWASPGTSSNSYVLVPPANPPSNGQLMSFYPTGTIDYGGGLSLPTYQGSYVDPSAGSGSITINEVASDPNTATLAVNSITASTATGNVFLKTATGVYSGAFSYVVDADYPLILSSTVPTSGNQLVVVYNQNMADGTELGDWLLSCDSGNYALTAPTGTTTSAYTYPISGGPVHSADLCQLFYTMPTDGVEAADDGVKLQSISGADIANNSTYVPSAPSGTLFELDFNSTQAVDLADWTTSVPAGILTTDRTTSMFDGTQYMFVNNNAGGTNTAYSPILETPVETIYYRYIFQSGSINTSSPHGLLFQGVGGTVEIGRVFRTTNVYVTQGTASANVSNVPMSSWQYVCGRITVASSEGADDGQHVINVGDSSNPENNVTATITTGQRHELIDRIGISQNSSNSLSIENVHISTSEISECGSL
jgi:hypothetical protein